LSIRLIAALVATLASASLLAAPLRLPPDLGRPAAFPESQSDLDEFMARVVENRDENWKKVQQYILDEREVIAVRGPARIPLFGERREFTWFIREGFFVRSPLKANGVTISEEERRKYEDDYLREAKLIADARHALKRDPARALKILEEAETSFPRGLLREEREALTILSLDGLGRTAQAQSRGRQFIEAHGKSPYADAVRQVLH